MINIIGFRKISRPELAGWGVTAAMLMTLATAGQETATLLAVVGLCLVWGIICRLQGRRARRREENLLQVVAGELRTLTAETEEVLAKLARESGEQLQSLRDETRQVRDLLDGAIDNLLASFKGVEAHARTQQSLVLDLTRQSQSGGAGGSRQEMNFEAFLAGVASVLAAFVETTAKNGALANALAEKMRETSAGFSDVTKQLREVKKIADQTNLLAINAAVEAARAGAAGKGFAVVAGEVRQLAVRSNRFSEEIAESVREIANAITEVETAMQTMAQNEGALVADSNQKVAGLMSSSHNFNRRVESTVTDISDLASQVAKEVAVAVTSLQFHDMVIQVVGHADKRIDLLTAMLVNLGQVNFQGTFNTEVGAAEHSVGLLDLQAFRKGLEEASSLIETVRHNPVSQRSMEVGTIELF